LKLGRSTAAVSPTLGSMLKFEVGLIVEVMADIEAPIERVWEAVTDISLSSQYSTEFVGAEWIDDRPRLGASFRGRNQRGSRTWETTSWVNAYEPMKVFGWAVSDPTNPGATWTFSLQPIDGATRLRFNRLLGPGPSGMTARIEREPDREHELLASRNEQHRVSMQAVVDGV